MSSAIHHGIAYDQDSVAAFLWASFFCTRGQRNFFLSGLQAVVEDRGSCLGFLLLVFAWIIVMHCAVLWALS
jgi:hypothetical protein